MAILAGPETEQIKPGANMEEQKPCEWRVSERPRSEGTPVPGVGWYLAGALLAQTLMVPLWILLRLAAKHGSGMLENYASLLLAVVTDLAGIGSAPIPAWREPVMLWVAPPLGCGVALFLLAWIRDSFRFRVGW